MRRSGGLMKVNYDLLSTPGPGQYYDSDRDTTFRKAMRTKDTRQDLSPNVKLLPISKRPLNQELGPGTYEPFRSQFDKYKRPLPPVAPFQSTSSRFYDPNMPSRLQRSRSVSRMQPSVKQLLRQGKELETQRERADQQRDLVLRRMKQF